MGHPVTPFANTLPAVGAQAGLPAPLVQKAPETDARNLPASQWPEGMVEPGNINLYDRPVVNHPDAKMSSVYSTSSQDEDGLEVVIPQVSDDGRMLTSKQAWAQYKKTGKHLGKFNTAQTGDTYGQRLHEDYEAGEYGDARSGQHFTPQTTPFNTTVPNPEVPAVFQGLRVAPDAAAQAHESVKGIIPKPSSILDSVRDTASSLAPHVNIPSTKYHPGSKDVEDAVLGMAKEVIKHPAAMYGTELEFGAGPLEGLFSGLRGEVLESPGLHSGASPENVKKMAADAAETAQKVEPKVPFEEKWTPPQGIEKGIAKEDAVDTNIPLSELSVGEDAYNGARSDNSRGRGSKTKGPISVVHNPDTGQYLVEDGMHRLAEAHQRGETEIPAKVWSGYSDIASVHGDKADLSPEVDVPFEADPAKAAADQGVEYRGKGLGLHTFQDPLSKTSVSIKEAEFTPEKLEQKLKAAREKMAANPPRKVEETPEAATPEATTADPAQPAREALDSITKKYGTSYDASKTRNGASFITPEGKFVHLGHEDHPHVIAAHGFKPDSQDLRVPFINDSGAIRSNFTRGRQGDTLSFSVPKEGVNAEQIDAMKRAVKDGLGRNGQLRIETATNPTNIRSAVEDFATANKVEPMLRKIGAHPGEDWAQAAAKSAAENGGGFTVNPTTGEMPKEGHALEVYPEAREKLNHTATPQDIDAFHQKNKELFDEHPELHIGGFGDELNVSAIGPREGAEHVASKLDQKSIWDFGKQEEIPTGGAGEKTDFTDYPLAQRLDELKNGPPVEAPAPFEAPEGLEHLPQHIFDELEPDEKKFLSGKKIIQQNVVKEYAKLPPIEEVANAMKAGGALAGWWKRYIDVFKGLGETDAAAAAEKIGPSHTEILKQWHAALSGNKSVQDANNLAWHSYADWLDAGKPTDRKSIDNIVRQNGAQPEGSEKKGNASISDTLHTRGKKRGQIKSKGIDTNKLFQLINSPEMRGERPFGNNIFGDNPLAGTTSGAVKIPSMGATVAGEGNLRRLVVDTHIKDFYGQNKLTDARYIADSVHLRQAAKSLGLQPGEGQEQLWGTVLGVKQLLKSGIASADVGAHLSDAYIASIGKDYAEVIKNDPELNAIFDRLKKYGLKGSEESRRAIEQTLATKPKSVAGAEKAVDQKLLGTSAERIRGQISDSKIKAAEGLGEKKAKGEDAAAGWLKMMRKPDSAAGSVENVTMYHGSPHKFSNFELRPGKNSTVFGSEDVQRAGIFFSPDKSFADEFKGKTGQTTAARLSIKKLADMSNTSVMWGKLSKELTDAGINGRWLDSGKTWEKFDGEDGTALVKALKKLGYDGVKINEPNNAGKDVESYIVFHPDQIRKVESK